MTNLLTVLPDFDIKPFTHILPSLEKALISTADLLTVDAPDIAKRAQVPPGEVKKLATALVAELQATSERDEHEQVEDRQDAVRLDHQLGDGLSLVERWRTISSLDDGLDAALNGGIGVGCVTEIVGERLVSRHVLAIEPR